MGLRTDLHELLVSALGTRNVYFQPPTGFMMKYPCIVYELDKITKWNANNRFYSKMKSYSVTVIDKDPESLIVERVSEFPMCRFDRHFENDNLHHTVFTIYY